ncbi:RHS repeat-associated core domain-containing protein [Xanthocytophaga agilis]|uniref:RHS repeat-associated core domain-containing protein n=1 Tax=Xanthocytophaga agilis TaxID=3048010 RepID=UPI003B004622
MDKVSLFPEFIFINGIVVLFINYTCFNDGKATVSGWVFQKRVFIAGSYQVAEPFGLNWIDLGARMDDSQIGRWHAIDNKSEKYYALSPYTYAANNPIMILDPDGMAPYDDDYSKIGKY